MNMMEQGCKDSISQHYTDTERITLAELVGEKKHIVENKKTNSSTTKEKNDAWQKITDAYNVLGFPQRNSKQLKKCWDNMKQRKRKLSTERTHERLATGGGPPIKRPIDPVLELIDVLAPHADFQLECPWDSTTVFETQNQKANITPNISIDSTLEGNGVENKENSIENIPLQTSSVIQSHTPSTSSSMPIRSNAKLRLQESCARCICKEETKLRIQKLRESIKQQQELHEKRMKVAEEEVKLAILKTLLAEREGQNYL